MILIPKYMLGEPERPIISAGRMGFHGEFKYILRDLNLNPLFESEWSSNTILTSGLPLYGDSNPFQYCNVGSNGTAADISQTGMLTYMDSNDSQQGDSNEFGGNPSYSHIKTRAYRFNAGTATGTIREMGVAADDDGTDTYCRHVVSPEINKSVDQVLDVYYKHSIFPPLGDTVGSVTMNGVLYDTLTKGCNLDSTAVNHAMTAPSGFSNSWGSAVQQVYDGNIGTNIEGPSGDATNYGTDSNQPYTFPNLYRDVDINASLNQANTNANIIRSIQCAFSGFRIQVQFNENGQPDLPENGIPKDNTYIWGITLRQSWGRYVGP